MIRVVVDDERIGIDVSFDGDLAGFVHSDRRGLRVG
jgi:hypothetical protein